MNPNLDDPKLTAYALGELDPAERAEVESVLAEDPGARAWVEAVQKTAAQLESELKAEGCPQLTPEQANAIETELMVRAQEAKQPKWKPQEQQERRPLISFRLVELLAAVAIIATLAAMLLPALSKAKSKSQRVAQLTEQRRREMEEQLVQANSPPQPRPLLFETIVMPQPARMKDQNAVYSQNVVGYADTGVNATSPEAEMFSRRYGIARGKEPVAFGDMPKGSNFNTESYAPVADNPFLKVADNPLSTFSIDVDTASYAIVRRFLGQRQLPPKDAVRIEEMINYFPYDYRPPKDGRPFAVNVEIASCPWNESHRLVRVGLKGREIARDKRPPSNLVFLVDVSGSMQPANKLPLLKQCLKLLTKQLTEDDHVSIVVYAGSAGEVLPSTSGDSQKKILRALDALEAGGSTHGSQGIQLAYQTAVGNFIPGGVNRVILCTDGDFNVGVTSPGELLRLIEAKAKSGVFLSVLGFGMGNYKDSTVEMLADKGNGNYAYIDTLEEGRKVLVEQMSGTLVAIAKDVKIQVEFNPAQASAYRLIGYENRLLNKEDFNNDEKDAGDIGAGHTVTALYEVVSAGESVETTGVDPLKYQRPQREGSAASEELLTLKLRYKEPDGDTSKLLVAPVTDQGRDYEKATADFKFAAAVAEFGMILRDSPHKGTAAFDSVRKLANAGLDFDEQGYRAEFLQLVERARGLSRHE